MRSSEINTNMIDGYLRLLSNLNLGDKLDLISKLTESVKQDLTEKESGFEKSFGAFESGQSAEELIDEIRSSRVFNREIEPL